MEHSENQIILRGSLVDLPQFSHENHRKRFYRFTLCVPRLSGAEDLLPVVASEQVLEQMDLSGGTMLRIEGQIRTHNVRENGTRRLLIFVFADEGIACRQIENHIRTREGRVRGRSNRSPHILTNLNRYFSTGNFNYLTGR